MFCIWGSSKFDMNSFQNWNGMDFLLARKHSFKDKSKVLYISYCIKWEIFDESVCSVLRNNSK